MPVFLILMACNKGKNQSPGAGGDQPGFVTGIAKDMQGRPLAGVKVKMDNSLSSGRDYEAITDSDGKYRIEVGVGSFIAFARYTAEFEGRYYEYELACNDNKPFNSKDVVRRDFTWKASGVKSPPLSAGYFGGSVYVSRFPGDTTYSSELITFTLVPVVTIDGSLKTITARLIEDPYRLLDIPVGRYRVRAKHQDGRVMKLRNINNGMFTTDLEVSLMPAIEGDGNLYCWNCASIEYRE